MKKYIAIETRRTATVPKEARRTATVPQPLGPAKLRLTDHGTLDSSAVVQVSSPYTGDGNTPGVVVSPSIGSDTTSTLSIWTRTQVSEPLNVCNGTNGVLLQARGSFQVLCGGMRGV